MIAEIKATRNPGPRDVRNLVRFGKSLNRPTRLQLFYLGNKYGTLNDVQPIPVDSLYRVV